MQLLAGADRQACFPFLKEQTVSILAAHLDEDLNRLWCLHSAVWSLQWRADKYLLGAMRRLKTKAPLTLMPSMRKPMVAVELSVSLHCMYLGLRIPCWARSSSVGAPGSTATILSYMSFRKRGRSRAFFSSSSKYVLEMTGARFYITERGFHFFKLVMSLHFLKRTSTCFPSCSP